MHHRQAKRTEFRKSITVFLGCTILVIAGCAAEPMRVEFPIDSPVNPEANETAFTPPPNPFQTDVAAMEGGTATDSSMPPETREEMSQPHMDHNMGQKEDNPSAGESSKKTPHEKNENQHQEHPQ